MSTKKKFLSVLILWHLFTLAVDGLPNICLLQENFQFNLSRYMNVVAQWQGSLAFFAPSPDSLNLHLEANFEYTDGTTAHWRSPEWRKLSFVDKFLNVRLIKFIDNVRRDDNRLCWESFARYLASEVEARDHKKVRHVELSRHWADVPPPKDGFYNPITDPPHKDVYTFYKQDFT